MKSLPQLKTCLSFPVSWRVFSHTSLAPICHVAGENLNKENACTFESFRHVEQWSHFLLKFRQHQSAQLTQIQIKSLQQYKEKCLPIIYWYFLYISSKFFSLLRQPQIYSKSWVPVNNKNATEWHQIISIQTFIASR